jgi:hypothetical protein
MEHASSHSRLQVPAGTTYNINLQVDTPPKAGEVTQLSFAVTEQKAGDPLQRFELLHDRLMHLIIVDESLSYFEHVHPALQTDVFLLSHVFPVEGRYKLWAEVKPADGEPVLAAFRLNVAAGRSRAPKGEPPAESRYRVRLNPSSRAPLHEPVELVFEVADSAGRPVTDLEPLMAAGGHCVVISSDLRDFVHVHPVEEVDPTWRGGPRVRFLTSFHRPVLHKIWGQFQHGGELITAGFEIEVHAPN